MSTGTDAAPTAGSSPTVCSSSIYPAASYDDGSYAFGQPPADAIPLDEYDFGTYNR